jgi:glucokinase
VAVPGTESNHPRVVLVSTNGPVPDLAGCKPAVRQTKCLRYAAREFVGSQVRLEQDRPGITDPRSRNMRIPAAGVRQNRLGRPRPTEKRIMILGIEIGGTKLQLVAGDSRGNITERRKLGVDPRLGAAGIRKQIQQTIPDLASQGSIESVGVGFGGPVDWKTGKICKSHQIEGWSEFDLAGWLGPLTGAPVVVDNDANVAALGEALHGAGTGLTPCFYVTLGSGVGGGLVVDQSIYHGATPGEAEIGHVRLDRQGTVVESRCSGWAVDARIRALKKNAPESLLIRMAAKVETGESQFLLPALEQGDTTARRILEEIAEDLAFALSHVVHLFHPQIVVLGGGLSKVGEPLRSGVENALGRFLMDAFAPGPRIALAKLGEDAVPVGALELAKAVQPKR